MLRVFVGIFVSLIMSAITHANNFTLSSTGFSDNGKIPSKYTCNGLNTPPTLNWMNAPENTQTFALIISDPDAGIGQPFYNWVIYNIPKKTNSLIEMADLPDGALVGNNTYGEPKYSGPCPVDTRMHHYIFMLYALDTPLYLSDEPDLEDVLSEVEDHSLATAKLTGLYNH